MAGKVNFYASREHYIDHLAPVWNALDSTGDFYIVNRRTMIDRCASYGIDPVGASPHYVRGDHLWVVAGMVDLSALGRAVLVEHGAGQSYAEVSHGSWSGGTDRDNVVLNVVPNETVARRNLARYPLVPNVIAAPRLEYLRERAMDAGATTLYGTVFGRHWDSHLTPELQSAWPHHFEAIRRYCLEYSSALHFHPRCEDSGKALAREWDIPYLDRFDDVVRHAGVYVVDNSSCGFEWAAMPFNTPLVWLNAPHYRRDLEQGLRFWKHVDVGMQCEGPDDIEDVIRAARLSTTMPDLQRLHLAQIFPVIEGSADIAATAIKEIS